MANPFLHQYLPNTESQRADMLRAIGIKSVDRLFVDIPDQFRDPFLNLPDALSELDLRRELEALARLNLPPGEYACFLGGGAYRHFIPSVVESLLSRGELLTAYTPYQAEASQGTLQATYDYQSLMCLLTGMEVANAGMYEGSTAFAEAALMACRITHRSKVAVSQRVNPSYQAVLRTYLEPQGIQITSLVDNETAALLVQYPDYFGAITSLSPAAEAAHDVGALLVVSTYPTALGLIRPPGDYGADIVTGECQSLGVPLAFGGPYVGLLACRERYLRQMPGRVVGKTVDTAGKPGYVLTLQTREQHIRREGATSNICTSEALVAMATTMYLAALGPIGLRNVAELCYQRAHYAASLIAQLPGYSILSHPAEEWRDKRKANHGAGDLGSPSAPAGQRSLWFNEFMVRGPTTPPEINRRLLEHQIIGGLDISATVPDAMLVCVTEMNSREEIEALAETLKDV
jgi:glycine dehydrogenase subunit 1